MAQLCSVCRARGDAIVWIALDEGDNDVSRFLGAFAASLAAAQGQDADDAIPAQTSEIALWIKDHIATFGPIALFLDELEVIRNPIVLGLIARGIESAPPSMRIVLGARAMPDVGLGRLRTRAELGEVDIDTLRFSESEAVEFLTCRRGLDLTSEQVHVLLSKTEGWAAGLWLASLTLERPGGSTQHLAGFSGSCAAVAAYLAEDVFAALPGHLQDFVLRASILDELSPTICNVVCDVDDSLSLLRELQHRNLFIQLIDPQRNLFRYHGLFRDFLRTLAQRRLLSRLTALHVSALEAYLQDGQPILAIHHALEAPAIPVAIKLLYEHAGVLLDQGRLRMVGGWLERLPEAELARHARLLLMLAWCRTFTHGPLTALAALSGMESPQVPGDAIAYLLALRPMLMAMTDRVDEAHKWGLDALKMIPQDAAFARSMLYQALAQTCIIVGDHEQAKAFIEQLRGAQRNAANGFGIALADSAKALLELMGGRLRQATVSMTAATRRPRTRSESDRIGNAVAAIQLAEVLYEGNRCDEAERLLFVNVPLIQEVGVPDALISAHVIQSRMADERGDYERALDLLNELEMCGYRLHLARAVASARLERSRLYLVHRNPGESLHQLTQAESALDWNTVANRWLVANDVLTPQIARVRWLIRTGDPEHALPQLRSQLIDAEHQRRARRALKLRILLAEALSCSGDRAGGLRTLARAKHIAQADGFVRTFLEESPVLQSLLQELSMRRGDVADSMLRGSGHYKAKRAVAPASNVADAVALNGPLSNRELQVIRLLAQGCRNDDLAEHLFVSDSTVRTHLRSINQKLHAASRFEAVVIARRLRLIL